MTEEQELELPEDVEIEIVKAVSMRAQAKAMEEEAGLIKKEANDILLPLMVSHNIKTYGVEGIGKVIQKVSKGSSIGSAKLTEQLLLEKLSPRKISGIIGRSSTSWEKEYVEFRVK